MSALDKSRDLAQLRAVPLPTARDEYWRYTDLAEWLADAPKSGDLGADAAAFGAADALKIVFADGVFDAEASDDLAMSGLEIVQLSHMPDWANSGFGGLELRGQNPVARPFAALNTAQAQNGLAIRATAKIARPVSLIYISKSDACDVMLHHYILVETGAELTLLESGNIAARCNIVTEVEVADHGAFHHIRMQGPAQNRAALTHIFARLGVGAQFKSFTLSANGRTTRNEAIIEMIGDDAAAHVAGAALGAGAFHHDDTVFITHQGLRGQSRQVFKKVLQDGAVGVFQGKILVKQGAQKTDGYQISQALLLDGASQFLAKPELEIYADDVKCSHGSTTGAIDDTALFYLQSRGVPKRDAQALLVLAFLAEALDEIADSTLKDVVAVQLAQWLDGLGK